MVNQSWIIGAGIYDPQADSPIVKEGTDPQVREKLKYLSGRRFRMPIQMERMLRSQSSTIRMGSSSVVISISTPLIITERP
jgi:hypothetical protein